MIQQSLEKDEATMETVHGRKTQSIGRNGWKGERKCIKS